MGDGILSIFGAPASYIENQYNAVYCAIEMVRALTQVNEEFNKIIGAGIKIGIGINTGEVIVGNVGSEEDRVEYTVIGDTVNTAFRMEKLSKGSENMILISQSTYDAVKERIRLPSPIKFFGKHLLSGKSNEVDIYQVDAEETNKQDKVPMADNKEQH